MNLLIVDDEFFSVEALQNSIHWPELGINHVFSCYDIEDAKELLENESIDVMICDIEMPSGSGLDLVEWVKKQELPVISIMLTCHPDFDYAVTAMRHRAFSYLLKPFNFEEIKDTVKKAVLEARKLQKETIMKDYAKKWTSNRGLIQEQFWYQMITGIYENCDSDYIQWECFRKNVVLSENCLYTPLLFCIISEDLKEFNISLLNFAVKNVLSEVFLTTYDCPPAITLSRHMYAVLLPSNTIGSNNELQKKCQRILDFFAKYYQLELKYFYSSPSNYLLLSQKIAKLKSQAESFLEKAANKNSDTPSIIDQSISIIRKNPCITKEELAKQACLNPDYFAKLFKKETKQTLSDYIADVKLEEAKYLLTQTSDSISSIASRLAFSNFSYFSKMFRKRTGMTPTVYRRQYYGKSASDSL